ncbi:uncharacterized protein LOC110934739 [Helianthus annuus]|uniref:uncharacterized protein LOC110934739 n=1 Tax=Helianthus annuus TaxID=4232 RepID=UPI0016533337|nr:uncharacterized protein LOC110934739 [Helianthus annuus]
MSLHFVAYSLQDLEKTVISSKNKIEEEEGAMFSQPEKATLNVAPFSSEVGVKGRVIGGRKVAKMVNKEHINNEEAASKKASSSSSETPSKCDHKPHKRSKKIDHNVHQVEGKMSSTFMVINADYHVPRSHPPKNN